MINCVSLESVTDAFRDVLDCDFPYISEYTPRERIEDLQPIKVVPQEDYDRLLKAARKMHTWIFLNTGDEQKAYDECGLTDEENILLGYIGQIDIAVKDGEANDG